MMMILVTILFRTVPVPILAIAGLISYLHSSRTTTSVILETLVLAMNLITYYSDDPLWDGAGCGEISTCCQFNNPPWFYSTLPQATTGDVEVHLCHGEGSLSTEDTIVYLIEINVQP